MLAVLFHRSDVRATAREEFQRDASRASEEVKGFEVFKVHVGAEHVEEVFLGKVRGRACLERAGNFKVFPLIKTSNDAQRDEV